MNDVDTIVLRSGQEIRGCVLKSEMEECFWTLTISYSKTMQIKIPHELSIDKITHLKTLENCFVSILRIDDEYHVIIESEPKRSLKLEKIDLNYNPISVTQDVASRSAGRKNGGASHLEKEAAREVPSDGRKKS